MLPGVGVGVGVGERELNVTFAIFVSVVPEVLSTTPIAYVPEVFDFTVKVVAPEESRVAEPGLTETTLEIDRLTVSPERDEPELSLRVTVTVAVDDPSAATDEFTETLECPESGGLFAKTAPME